MMNNAATQAQDKNGHPIRKRDLVRSASGTLYFVMDIYESNRLGVVGWRNDRVYGPYRNLDPIRCTFDSSRPAPSRVCGHCGSPKPDGESCGCFDNNCQ